MCGAGALRAARARGARPKRAAQTGSPSAGCAPRFLLLSGGVLALGGYRDQAEGRALVVGYDRQPAVRAVAGGADYLAAIACRGLDGLVGVAAAEVHRPERAVVGVRLAGEGADAADLLAVDEQRRVAEGVARHVTVL